MTKQKRRLGRMARVPETPCLNCLTLVDAASPVDKRGKPRPGDITVCLYCGHVMAFADDLAFRELTSDEMHEVAGNKSVLDIQRARGMVKK